MRKAAYGARGIYTPLEAMFPYVPIFVEAVLIPFRDMIISDGLLQSFPVQIRFGAGARRAFNEQYSAARAAGQVRIRLPWQDDPNVPIHARRSPKPRKPRRRPTRSGSL